ncbi:hypothetical protein IWQ60_010813 [Tieghemiomyces parasiticus]|uniref:Early meiotic induction protein 1 n=1 Tax=Tieghemiomyces parasiticus TaxID=78921 RepID=A0A9W7ZS16_9FUNG|nr:hypothetical protein IWQ60_010813 [Tieghemiomyces parasiticus]
MSDERSTRPPDPASQPALEAPEELECSVRRAVDDLFACNTVGSHLINYYRYGKRKDCGPKWDRLKLCLKVNLMTSERKQKLLHDYENRKVQGIYDGPNVTDVMSERIEPPANFPPDLPFEVDEF